MSPSIIFKNKRFINLFDSAKLVACTIDLIAKIPNEILGSKYKINN